ncbi:MAG TPA: hypothetical protein VF458_07190 [Ktedonobacteraceae bacterium]
MMPSMMFEPGFDLFFWVIFLALFSLFVLGVLLRAAWNEQREPRAVGGKDCAQPHAAYEQGYRAPQQAQEPGPEDEHAFVFAPEQTEQSHYEQEEIVQQR